MKRLGQPQDSSFCKQSSKDLPFRVNGSQEEGKKFPAAGAQPLSKCRWSVIRSPCDEQAGNQKKREPSGIAVQESLASLNPRDRLARPGRCLLGTYTSTVEGFR